MFEKLLSGPVATITCRHFTFLHGSSLPMFAKLLMKLLDIFNVTSGHFPAGYFNGTAGIRVTFNVWTNVVAEPDIFNKISWQFVGVFSDETGHCFSYVCGKKVDIFHEILGKICSWELYIFRAVCSRETGIFNETLGHFFSCFCGNTSGRVSICS